MMSLSSSVRGRPGNLKSEAGGGFYSHPSVLDQLPGGGSRSFFPHFDRYVSVVLGFYCGQEDWRGEESFIVYQISLNSVGVGDWGIIIITDREIQLRL